jgi:nucleotide-binding universal stress UspA family protein
MSSENTGRIVVGVDGSPGSKKALAWALRQATLTGAAVEAVATWRDPATYGLAVGYAYTPTDSESYASLISKDLDNAIAEVSGTAANPVPVHPRVAEGPAAQMLLEAAVGAELLVVGSRGHGAFAGMLLGSVSQHCVQHAPCPVVVVP